MSSLPYFRGRILKWFLHGYSESHHEEETTLPTEVAITGSPTSCSHTLLPHYCFLESLPTPHKSKCIKPLFQVLFLRNSIQDCSKENRKREKGKRKKFPITDRGLHFQTLKCRRDGQWGLRSSSSGWRQLEGPGAAINSTGKAGRMKILSACSGKPRATSSCYCPNNDNKRL
jgi:hypothetical protein